MENENVLDANLSKTDLIVNADAKEYLRQTSKWSKVLAVMSIVLSIFIMIFGTVYTYINYLKKQSELMALNVDPSTPNFTDTTSAKGYMMGYLFGSVAVFVVIALMMIYPAVRLFQFSKQSKKAVDTNDGTAMEAGFRRLRSVFRFYGILTILTLFLYAIAILGAIVMYMNFKS